MNTTTKLYGLDHLRALAILLVFISHYLLFSETVPEWLPAVAQFGWSGVDLFFVLSGFLISSQLFMQTKKDDGIDFRTFYLKRIFRILPAFFVVLAIYYSFPFFREKEALPPLWRFLTFTQNFGLNLRTSGTFSHAWSLCVEEHFYLLFPFVLFLVHRFGIKGKGLCILFSLFAAGFAARLYSYQHFYAPLIDSESAGLSWYKFIYYPTYNRLDGLLFGVSIATLYHFRQNFWSKISRYGNLVLLAGLAVLSYAYNFVEDQHSFHASVFGYPMVSFGYALLVVGALSPGSILFKWKSKVTTLIATLSYSLYLTHKGMIHISHYFIDRYEWNDNFVFLLCFIICCLASLIIYLLVEKPFMELRKRIV